MKRRLLFVLLPLFLLFPSAGVTAEKSFTVSAESAVLIEMESGRVLWESDAYSEKRIASITKIMTALIAIEQGDLEEKVEISDNAAGTEGSSLYLQAGEKVKLEDLLYGLMLRSGNDSAVAIAEHIAGSVEGFVFLMNERVRELGLEDTIFANPHGLDDHEGHYSTAFDMAMIMKAAMELDKFREISGTKIHRAPNEAEGWDRVWKNKNRLLTEKYEHSTGGKTGYTKRANRTLVTTAEKEEMELIAVTLNAPSDWDDHIRMFEHGFESYEMTPLVQAGDLDRGQEDIHKNLEIRHSLTYPLTEDEQKRILFKLGSTDHRLDPLHVGNLQLRLDDTLLAKLPVYKKSEESEQLSWWERVKNRIEEWWSGAS